MTALLSNGCFGPGCGCKPRTTGSCMRNKGKTNERIKLNGHEVIEGHAKRRLNFLYNLVSNCVIKALSLTIYKYKRKGENILSIVSHYA